MSPSEVGAFRATDSVSATRGINGALVATVAQQGPTAVNTGLQTQRRESGTSIEDGIAQPRGEDTGQLQGQLDVCKWRPVRISSSRCVHVASPKDA